MLAGASLKKGDVVKRDSRAGACSVLVLTGLPFKRGILPAGTVAQVHALYLCWQGKGGCCQEGQVQRWMFSTWAGGASIKKGDVARRGRCKGGCSVLGLAGLPLKRGILPGGAVAQVHALFLCWQGFH